MKKILVTLTILLVICVSVFAVDVSVNLGAGATMNKNDFYLSDGVKEEIESSLEKYESNMFKAELGVEVEFENQLTLYETVGFGLPSEMKFTVDGDSESWDLTKSLFVSDALGVGYKFHFGDFDLLTAAGIYGDIMSFKLKEDTSTKGSICNLGVNLNLKGTYNFNEHFGVMLALRPNMNLYNSWTMDTSETDGKIKDDGAKTGFALAGVLGVEYKF